MLIAQRTEVAVGAIQVAGSLLNADVIQDDCASPIALL